MSFLSNLGPPEFLSRFLDMFPPGRAFSGEPDTAQVMTFTPPADALASLHAEAMRLLEREADPFYTLDLLAEWEKDWGLPDPCTPAAATVEQRRAALLAKIAALGGQSPAYFVGVAAALGYTITITECPPWRLGETRLGSPLRGPGWEFVWRVHAPQITIRYFRLGSSRLGERLAVVSNSDLQCRLNAIKPAHTLLVFVFS